MKNLKNYDVLELNTIEISETNGGGLTTGITSLFRSSLYMGQTVRNVGLATLGFLAGLGDGIRNGMNN
jgi:hypothetical protein